MGRPKPPTPMRIAVNDTGSYAGRVLVETLVKQGHTVVALCEADGEAVPEAVVDSYTMQSFTNEFNKNILSCDAVVMQLEGHTKSAADVLQVLTESELHKDKVFVGISSLMTWAGTKPSKAKLAPGEEPPEGEEDAADEGGDEDGDNPDRREPLERGAVVEADWGRREVGSTFHDKRAEYPKKVRDLIRPDPEYTKLSNCEKLVARSGKEGLRCFVIHSGLLYGRGEGDLLHPFFKDAWELKPVPFPWDPTQPVPSPEQLEAIKAAEEEEAAKKAAAEEAGEEYEPGEIPTVRGRGENMVPTIHVEDLAKVTAGLVAAYPGPASPYILAVDRSRLSMRDLLGALSKQLGNGALDELDEKTTVTIPEVEKLHVDLVVQQSQELKKLLKWNKWTCREGPVACMETVLNEYRSAAKPAPRGIGNTVLPLKMFLHGPPGRGPGLADALAKHYKVRVLRSEDVIKEAMALEPKKFGRAMRHATKKLEGRLPDRVLCEMYRRVLTTQPCKNQGFIMDGFPKTYTQAKWLTEGWKEHEPAEGEEEPPPEADPDFTYGYTRTPPDEDAPPDEEEEEEPEEEPAADDPEEDEEAREKRLARELAKLNKQCTAEFVFSLDASDSTIEARAAERPEAELMAGHDDEAGIRRRLALFRATEGGGLDTAPSCWEDNKVTVHSLGVDGRSVEEVLADIVAVCGEPRNYGLTEEEKKAIREAAEAKAKEEAKIAAAAKAKKDKEEAEEHAKKVKQEEARKEEIASMDESALLRAAMPLRKYLESNVMAVVRRGLIECAEVRPNDPIDYLAEYLLENNTVVE